MKEANIRMERVMEKFKSHQNIIEKKDAGFQEKYLYLKTLLENHKQRNLFEQKQFDTIPETIRLNNFFFTICLKKEF